MHYTMLSYACLFIFALPILTAQNNPITRCDQLKRENFSFSTLTDISSPFTSVYVNSAAFNCTREIYSEPARGTTGYDGIVTILSGSSYTFLKLKVEADGATVRTINCDDKTELKWWILASNYNGVDGYFCPYTCSADGISFDQFACKSLSSQINPEIETKIIPMVSKVPGADKIFPSHINCAPTKDCGMFI